MKSVIFLFFCATLVMRAQSANGVPAPAASEERWSCAAAYGLKGDGKTDQHAAIQTCLNSGHREIYLAPDNSGGAIYSIGDSTITVPGSIARIDMAPGVCLLYSGLSTATVFAGTNNGEYELCVKRTHADWDADPAKTPDRSSVGIKIVDTSNSTFRVTFVGGFATGIQITNSKTDSAGNLFYLPDVEDNMIGLNFLPTGAYGTNQNTVAQARIRINGSHCPGNKPLAGTKYILLAPGSDNNNVFINPNLENQCVAKALEVHGGMNTFISPRFEGTVPDGVQFAEGTRGNVVYNPYLSAGAWRPVVSDLGQNMFFGAIGWRADTDGSAQPWEILSDRGKVVWQIGSHGTIYTADSMTAAGRISGADGSFTNGVTTTPTSSSTIYAGQKGGIYVSAGSGAPSCAGAAPGLLYIDTAARKLITCIDGKPYGLPLDAISR